MLSFLSLAALLSFNGLPGNLGSTDDDSRSRARSRTRPGLDVPLTETTEPVTDELDKTVNDAVGALLGG